MVGFVYVRSADSVSSRRNAGAVGKQVIAAGVYVEGQGSKEISSSMHVCRLASHDAVLALPSNQAVVVLWVVRGGSELL